MVLHGHSWHVVFANQQDNIDHPALHDNNHYVDIGNNCNPNGNPNSNFNFRRPPSCFTQQWYPYLAPAQHASQTRFRSTAHSKATVRA